MFASRENAGRSPAENAVGMEAELHGSVALVTGAARNIGREIALALAQAGAAVVVNAKTSGEAALAVVAEIEAAGGTATALLADVTEPADVQRLIAHAVGAFGRLDILVNNAALRDEAPFEELTYARWRSVLQIVLDGAFLCTQAAAPHLRSGGRGAIVNIGGLTAHTGAQHRVHVVTAKAGLVGFTRALAHDLSPGGVTANLVVPGLIETTRDGAAPAHRRERKTLVGRHGRPDDIASAVRFLAGPGARYITGQTLQVNGGLYLG
jgi:3-oxoacyl-[acyl-carrier protein] reductase